MAAHLTHGLDVLDVLEIMEGQGGCVRKTLALNGQARGLGVTTP